jgi:hypothetical protein
MSRVATTAEAKLINSWWGDVFTKRFLKSQHVVMLSEGDFLNRLKICVRTVLITPMFLLFLGLFLYYRIAIIDQFAENAASAEMAKLFSDQKVILNLMIILAGVHLMTVFYALIVMLNLTMGKASYAFTMIFNVVYIAESLFYCSFVFLLDWSGIIKKFGNWNEALTMIRTQWIFVIVYIVAFISFLGTKKIFRDFNAWNREWIRIDRYRKTEDRENAFVFKTWVTPGEISARKHMMATAIILIIAANFMDLFDTIKLTDFDYVTYVILIAGYLIFIGTFVVPYAKLSLIYYWGCFTFTAVILVIGLYHLQNTAWVGMNFFEYAYVLTVIPFFVTLVGSVRYTWTIRNKEEIQAIVISEFETQEEFQNYVEQNVQGQEMMADDALNV